jgi:diguanylate cyclase (GGDEF)-like protein
MWFAISYRKAEKSKQLYLDMLSASDSMPFHWTIDSDSIVINKQWSKYLGFSIFELQPFSYRKAIKLVHPDDSDKVKQSVDALVHGEQHVLNLQFRIETKDAGYKWVLLSGRVSDQDKKGHPLKVSGSMTDCHESVINTILLEQHQHRDRFLLELPQLVQRHNEQVIADKALALLTSITSSSKAFLYLFSESQQALNLKAVATNGRDSQQELSNFLRASNLVTQVLPYKKPFIINNVSDNPELKDFLQNELQFTRAIFVPLTEHGEVVMLLAVANDENAEQTYSADDLQTVQLLAHQLWLNFQQKRVLKQLASQKQAMEQLAHFDSLTSLPNRNLVVDRIQQALERQKRNRKDLALLLIDLDGFSEINERYGNQAGDRLLQTLGQRYMQSLRKVDSLGRIGCDEFVVLIESYENSKNIMYIAKRLLEDSCMPLQFEGHELQTSASIGVFFYHEPEQQMTPDDLISKAELALQHAQKKGANGITVYQPGIK